ncbi:TPA: hypothetical protein DD712_01240 [Candidatus Acetothermia bacterium]|nr:hypothetical protein [Candidatus Acetothermia bacterium]
MSHQLAIDPILRDKLDLSRFAVLHIDSGKDIKVALFSTGKPIESTLGDVRAAIRMIRDHNAAVVLVHGKEMENILPPDWAVIDTELLAQILCPTMPAYTIPYLQDHYSLSSCMGADTAAIGYIFCRLIKQALSLPSALLSDLAGLSELHLAALFQRLIEVSLLTEQAVDKEKTTAKSSRKLKPTCLVNTDEMFTPDGPLATMMDDFELRLEQQQMAKAIVDLFRDGGTLVAEAGPGTGKTFAYLIPALQFLRNTSDSDKIKIVVSTRTKNLQDQIFLVDIPFLIPHFAPDINVALLKGQESYLCLKRWEELRAEITGQLNVEGERQLLSLLLVWREETRDGDIEECGAFLAAPRSQWLWSQINSDLRRCPGKRCPFIEDCFLIKARQQAKRANLLVTNHSLLLADSRAERAIIGGYQYLIIDEAHAIETAARHTFTETLSVWTITRLVRDLSGKYDLRKPDNKKTPSSAGWLSKLSLTSAGEKARRRILDNVAVLQRVNRDFFADIVGCLPLTDEKKKGRAVTAVRYQTPLPIPAAKIEDLTSAIELLQLSLFGLGDHLTQDEKRELEIYQTELEHVRALIDELFSADDKERVYWYKQRDNAIEFFSAPIKIADILEQKVYQHIDGLILTSATLSLNGDIDYLTAQLGLKGGPGDEIRTLILPSPFPYQQRMRIYLPTFLSLPDDSRYAETISALLERVISATKKKGLALFTSYRLLKVVADNLRNGAPYISLFVQEGGISRAKLVAAFKGATKPAVLLGTDSFWEGVDLPGHELEVLFITRLPFPVPTEPITAALSEKIQTANRNPFTDLFLPAAILKLRQGIGRLIRSRSDKGVVIITDQRVVTKSYGALFRNSLPVKGLEVNDEQALLLDLDQWFD